MMLKKIKRGFASIKHAQRALRASLRRSHLKKTLFVAITGSCGKTSTTQFLDHILGQQASCNTGIDGNTRISVIKTLLKTTSHHQYVIQEMSGDYPGRLSASLPIMRPHIGVVTTVGGDHYSNFRSLKSTAQEKGVLPAMLPENGVAVLNADDPHVLSMAERTKAKVLTYGLSNEADVIASDINFSWPEGLAFTVTYNGESGRVETKLFGKLWVSSLLAAISAALAAGVDLKSCSRCLSSVEPYNRRMSVHLKAKGVWYINDTFKAPFWSISGVIQTLKDIKGPRKTLVLGAFSDNPGSSASKYRALAKEGLEIADRVMFVGENSRYVSRMMTSELKERLLLVESVKEACRLLSDTTIEHEVVLIKSRKREHLERLIHGQTENLNCWKPECGRQYDCASCADSGIAPPAR